VNVWLRRSSAIRRMVNIGTSIISNSATVLNIGAATVAVTPGGLASCASCGCTSRNASSRARKNHAKINCSTARINQLDGIANRLRSSRMASRRIMIFFSP
jgi:hypothetical protein